MKYRTLGRTGLRVSEIGFGAWAIGGTSYGPTKDEESLEALETAWEHGVNFFDTADTYGHGHSEALIGKFLKGRRARAIVATKAGWDFYHGSSRKNFALDYLRFACDESLKRLQIDTIDLYQLHNPTLEQIEAGELFGLLDELKAAGKIRFSGVSVHTPREALAVIRSGRSDAVQLIFNLLDQRPVEEVFPEAEAHSIGIIAREPFACGLLTGKYTAESRFHKMDHRNRWIRERMARDLEKFERFRAEFSPSGITPPRAALEFILNQGAVSVVIPGAKTKPQVLENLRASEGPALRPEELLRLRETYLSEPAFQAGFYKE